MNYCIAEGKTIKIVFPDIDDELRDKVLSLTGRRYSNGEFFAPVTINNLNSLKDWGFFLDDDLRKVIERTKIREKEIIQNADNKLRQFQKEGIAFYETQNGRLINSDQMGLGKTIQTICWMNLHKDKMPVVIVCPGFLKLNWKRECEKWSENKNIEIIKGLKPYPTKGDILIINYDILHAWVNELKKKDVKILVLDEATAIKEKKTRRTKAVKKLKDIPHIICLTGTPVLNRQTELDNMINLVAPDSHPSMCYLSEGKIHTLLITSFMLRRLKKDVLKELPPKVYSFVPVELDNRDEYEKAEKDFIAWIRKEKGDAEAERLRIFEGLVKTEGLKQLATKGKMKQVIAWIKTFIESEKLVLFMTHTATIDALMDEFKDVAVKIDGSVSESRRQKNVDEFQSNPSVKLFVGMIDSKGYPAGIGWNLTSSSNVGIIELQWSPEILEQASDRCHRLGQTDSVTVYYLLAENTIEERIAKLLDEKRVKIDAMIDGKVTSQESLLLQLMKSYE